MNENVLTHDHHHWHKGAKFLKWGLSFFVLGLFFGFGVLIHYLIGSSYNTTTTFLGNVTLWFGSPLSLSVTYLQLGGLAMAILGVAKLLILKCNHDASCCTPGVNNTTTTVHTTDRGCGSLNACNFGLILLFIVGFIGYFVIDAIWPGFYYTPVVAGKNLWLILQGISILIFFLGYIAAFCCLCKHCKTCCQPKTRV